MYLSPMQMTKQIRPNFCLLDSKIIQISWNHLYLEALPKDQFGTF